MSNIECPHYGDNVLALQRSIAEAPSEDFFKDPTINQGYQYLLASIKNSAKYETEYQKLKEMHTYLVRLYALLNAYKATLESPAGDSTRISLTTALERLQDASTAISARYNDYNDMPQWKKDAVFWGTIFGYIALGLLIGLLAGAAAGTIVGAAIMPFIFGFTALLYNGPWIMAGVYIGIGGASLGGVIGGIIGGFIGTNEAEKYAKDGAKAPDARFFQKQRELTAKFADQPTADEEQEERRLLQA